MCACKEACGKEKKKEPNLCRKEPKKEESICKGKGGEKKEHVCTEAQRVAGECGTCGKPFKSDNKDKKNDKFYQFRYEGRRKDILKWLIFKILSS